MNGEETREIIFSGLPPQQKERFYQILCKGNYSFRYERQMFIAEFQLGQETMERKQPATEVKASPLNTINQPFKTPSNNFQRHTEQFPMSEFVENEPEMRLDSFSPIEPERSYVRPTKPVKRRDSIPKLEPMTEQPVPESNKTVLELAPEEAELIISNVNEEAQVSKPTLLGSPGEITRGSTKRKMSATFPEIHKIFPETSCKASMQLSAARTISEAFFEFVCDAHDVVDKQPQFAQAKFNVSSKTLQKALEQPQSAFCIFATNDHLETGGGSGQSDRVWGYIDCISSATDSLCRASHDFLQRNSANGLLCFSRIICECARQANKGQLAKATFLKVCRENVRKVQDFVEYVGRNYTLNQFVSIEEVANVAWSYISSSGADTVPAISQNTAEMQEMRTPAQPAQLKLPSFYIKAFNEQLMVDQSEFIPLADAMRLLLPAIAQAYSETLLQSIVQIPQIYIVKLRDTISQAIAANLENVESRMNRLGERSVTVGECYQLCVGLVQDVEGFACETAESILVSCGRVNM